MKRIFILLIVCSCWQIVPVCADVLVPLNLFAKQSKDTTKEHVFVWNGDQYSCDSPSALYFKTKEEAQKLCGLCPNREVKRMKGGDEYGHLKINGKTYYSCEERNCWKCENGRCSSKNKDEVRDVYVCVSKTIKKCPSDKPQLDTFGFCHSCDKKEKIDVSWLDIHMVYEDGKEVPVTKEDFMCDNRKLIALGWSQPDFYSVLEACPLDKPLQNYLGECYACDEPDVVITETKRGSYEEKIWDLIGFSGGEAWQGKQNNFCPNRVDIISSDRHPYYSVSSILKHCPANKPLRDEKGGCHTCDEPQEIIQNEAVAFWGNISYGKVYDKNANVIGKIVEATPFEKKREVKYTYRDSRSIEEEKLRDKKRKTGKFVPESDTEYLWDMYDLNDQQIGTVKMEFHGRCDGDKSCGSFVATIYDMQGNVIARGGGEHNGTNPKNNTSTYYQENMSDSACPNRKVYRTEIEKRRGRSSNVLVSGLKTRLVFTNSSD